MPKPYLILSTSLFWSRVAIGFCIVSLLLISCATSEINVEKGTFQSVKPPNIYGNGRYLEEGEYRAISFDANIGKNKTVPLPEVINSFGTQEIPANINYRLIENTLGFQYHKTTKDYNDYYLGFGVGAQNQPYVFMMLGRNGKFIEFGGAMFWGLTLNEASYEGRWDYETSWFMGWDESEYIKFKDILILHSYGGLVAYASFYLEKFALNYAASISNPWLVNKLPTSSNGADISFSFPVLLMQDIGISYTPNNIKYKLGVNQITGVKFPGQYWGLSVQMAYGW